MPPRDFLCHFPCSIEENKPQKVDLCWQCEWDETIEDIFSQLTVICSSFFKNYSKVKKSWCSFHRITISKTEWDTPWGITMLREEITKVGCTNEFPCEKWNNNKIVRHKDDLWHKIFRKCAGIIYMKACSPMGNAIAFRYLSSLYVVKLHFHSHTFI